MLNVCSTSPMIRNYPELLEKYKKDHPNWLSDAQSDFVQKTDDMQQEILGCFLTSFYLIKKYPPSDSVIFCVGNTPAFLIPCLQTIDPTHWQSYRHIAYSGSSSTFKDKKSEFFYKKYLTSIGLDPKTIILMGKNIVIIDVIITGSGLCAFLKILFDWAQPLLSKEELKYFASLIVPFPIGVTQASRLPKSITYYPVVPNTILEKKEEINITNWLYCVDNLGRLTPSCDPYSFVYQFDLTQPKLTTIIYSALSFVYQFDLTQPKLTTKIYSALMSIEAFIEKDLIPTDPTQTTDLPQTSLTIVPSHTQKNIFSKFFYTVFGRFFGQSKL